VGTRISLVLLLFAAFTTAQTPPPRTFPLDSITIEGNRILSAAAITAASGLKRGEKADTAAFDAARDRLLASGYFETVGYRFKPSATAGYQVTFEVQEVTTLYPIRVDALPATTAEVTAYLTSTDPLFSGKLPGTKQVLDRTSREVEHFLASRNQPAEVSARVIALAPEKLEIDFTPLHGLPVVANVAFEGAKVLNATDLHNKMGEVAFGQPYTENNFRTLLDNQIRPLYDAKGYMRVTFPKIVTTPSAQVAGLDVVVTVNEADQYKLGDVRLDGPAPGDSARLLKNAKITALDQVKDGSDKIKTSLRHQGYPDAEVNLEKTLNDEKKTVDYAIVIEPGAQYRMGKLTVNGLGLDGEAAIRKMWSVPAGDPFPVEYPEVFLSKVKEEGIFDNLGDMKQRSDINRTTHVADVTLDFKGAPPKARAPRRPGDLPVH